MMEMGHVETCEEAAAGRPRPCAVTGTACPGAGQVLGQTHRGGNVADVLHVVAQAAAMCIQERLRVGH
jgi:hypothetical protein